MLRNHQNRVNSRENKKGADCSANVRAGRRAHEKKKKHVHTHTLLWCSVDLCFCSFSSAVYMYEYSVRGVGGRRTSVCRHENETTASVLGRLEEGGIAGQNHPCTRARFRGSAKQYSRVFRTDKTLFFNFKAKCMYVE